MRKLFVVFALFGGSALAQPILPSPPPGTPYRLAFVTSTQRDANSTDISDYNQFVQNVASTQPLLAGITWTAIASTQAMPAFSNTGTNPVTDGFGVPIYLLDGSSKIADNYPDLWDGTLAHDLNITELGTPLVSGPVALEVWTGTEANGARRIGEELGTSNPRTGNWNISNPNWVLAGNQPSFRANSLYAISNVISIVPEPSAFLCIGLVGVSFAGIRRWRRWARN